MSLYLKVIFFYIMSGAFALLAAVCFIVMYTEGIGSIRKGKVCTGHAKGTVLGMSHITSNNVPLPKVEYKVDDKIYYIAGPKFAGSVTKFASVGNTVIGASKTNLTVDGELPEVVHMTSDISASAKVIAERYPVGKEVDVYYDPSKPGRAYVERYAPASLVWSLYVPMILGVIFTAAALFFLGIAVLRSAGYARFI